MNDQLTAHDIQRMQEEIEHRKTVVRTECLEALKEARAQGDLSENFEYHAAKRAKNQNESRIRYLERMIKTARVVDDSSADDEVGINNTITVEFEDDHEVQDFKIVTTVRVDTINGLVSIESPIGKAMLGHKVGDRCYVEIQPGDGYYLIIRAIDKSTDDSNDRIRNY